ncbi:hypothetical protein NOCA2570064 [metagenome]|uniref:Uncharacterized protein n=1 Tax=metagenome TaxID=256318 RepID=A0A2P2CB12_9ZZZZ
MPRGPVGEESVDGLAGVDAETDGETEPAGGAGALALRPLTTLVPTTTMATTAAMVDRAAVRSRWERARARTASGLTVGTMTSAATW